MRVDTTKPSRVEQWSGVSLAYGSGALLWSLVPLSSTGLKEFVMGIVVSMLLVAVGAIMRFAITAEAEGFNVGTAGMVLMIVGIIGAVLSVMFWASWGGFPRRRTEVAETRTVTRDRDVI